MWWNIMKVSIAAITIAVVSDISQRMPRLGTLLLTIPIVSILAFVMAWTQHHDLAAVSRLSRETLILVPLGLPFFIPLAFADELGLGFWPAFASGVALASVTIGVWLWMAPRLMT